MLGKTEGRRRRGHQRMRRLDIRGHQRMRRLDIRGHQRMRRMDAMNMNLDKLWEIVRDREAWHAVVHGITKSWTRLGD